MLKFREFIEKDQLDQIKTDPSFKVKEEYSNFINEFITWVQDESQGSDIQEIRNKVLAFKDDLEDKNEDIQNLIKDKSTLSHYQKLYNGSIQLMDQFEDPPQDVTQLLASLRDSLNQLFIFAQSKVQI